MAQHPPETRLCDLSLDLSSGPTLHLLLHLLLNLPMTLPLLNCMMLSKTKQKLKTNPKFLPPGPLTLESAPFVSNWDLFPLGVLMITLNVETEVAPP